MTDTDAPTLADEKAAALAAVLHALGGPVLVTADQAAALLTVKRRTFSKLAATPGFPPRVSVWGDLVRYRTADLKAWVAKRPPNRSPRTVKEPK